MEVKLRRGAWHYRLQKWMFDEVPYDQNFCPYFWLTIFCLLASPVVLFFTGLNIVLFRPIGTCFDWIDDNVCEPFLQWSYLKIPVEEILPLYNNQWYDPLNNPDLTKKQKRKLRLWFKYVPNARDKLHASMDEFRKKELERKAQIRNRRAAREARSKAVYQSLIKYTKWLVYAIAATIVVGVTYGVWLAGYWLAGHVHVAGVLHVLRIGGGLALIAVVCTLSFLGIRKVFRCLSTVMSIPSFGFIMTIATGIGEFLAFFILFFSNFKKDHCPKIEWGD